jgi:alkanesulfonate monooxygenase SsuD/methylene tetrahydromethanopterin reductase-like flavin-dependent oxidoreductase (luciferase family)
MLEINVFHNGACDLPPTAVEVDGQWVIVNGGDLAQIHESNQRVLVAQVRQGILADRLGFNYWFMTEHHFQPEGAEFSPNPLLVETAIATQTRQIRLGQMANIITCWHPVRIAEQAAMLDVISGGRLEFGIGRGYQPRENEVFGWPYGSTIQDQERNRAYYEEAFDIILKCWTEPSFFHQGQFYTIPPVYTKWHHKQTIAYFSQPHVGRRLEEVLQLGSPDPYGGPNPVLQTRTILKQLSVFPQPLQKPYPQVWEPLTTPRSIRWAAQRGVNGYFIVEPNSRLRMNIEMYYEAAEKAGWPDRLQPGKPFKFGWDCERKRGIVTCRYVYCVPPGRDKDRELRRFKQALEVQWDYYGPFGFAAVLAERDDPMYDPAMKVDADLLLKKEVAIFGDPSHVAEKLLKIKEECGYEDFHVGVWFERAGFRTEEIEEEMVYFAEEVLPLLAKACGGQKKNEEVDPARLLPIQREKVR